MTIDLPHMLATGAIIFGVLWALEYSGVLHGASKLKRTFVIFVSLFIVLFVLESRLARWWLGRLIVNYAT